MSSRVWGFDLLRGLLAVGVMVYHYLAWSKVAYLYNLGTYGVYAFFVLSGASMYAAYSARMDRLSDIVPYAINRVFRILPLLLVVGIAIPLAFWLAVAVKRGGADITLSLSTLLGVLPTFGFTHPGAVSIATGAWSLGIEFVFYAIFPLLLALFRTSWRSAILCCAVFLVCQLAFVNMVLAAGTLTQNWERYIQYGSFGFYFAFGMLLGKHLGRKAPANGSRTALVVFAAAFVLLAVSSGDEHKSTLIGLAGLGMTVLVCTIVAASARLPLNESMRRVAHWLGVMSYPIYLLHPIAWRLVGKPTVAGMLGAAALTVVLSWLSWKLIEQPAIRFGRRIPEKNPKFAY